MRLVIAAAVFAVLAFATRGAPVRFIDSATGFSIPPDKVAMTGAQVLRGEDGSDQLSSDANTSFSINMPGYHPRWFAPESFADDLLRIFVLEPLESPVELRPERIAQLHRDDATLILGFVRDEATGRPLSGVSIWNGDTHSLTDDRGYFEIYMSCAHDRERGALRFSRQGYRTQERVDIPLFPRGDWIYRIAMNAGEGTTQIDEQPGRAARNAADPVAASFSAQTTGITNSPIPRVPRNIRILGTNALYYETLENYCRHSLPAEWIASWGVYTGGSNSLNAGAVAVRTYAVGYVNQPRGADHDICATTACQVYRPDVTHSRTDAAVNYTAGHVMVNANNSIPRGLTEYSAENNQLGMPCGDGFTAPTGGCLADPVCTGEAEFGHGRGMCQWGSARWATGLKFPNRSTSDNTTTNGFPRRDWIWILNHYYPNLRLVRASPLNLGDPVRVIGVSTPLNVRACPGGTITDGVNCPSLGTRPLGSFGYLVGGPMRVLADGQGYTWWKVRWQNGLEGWSVENYLDRYVPTNTAPQLAMVVDRVIHAGATLRLTNTAADNDFPPNSLTFSLPAAPSGATIHPATGLLTWVSSPVAIGSTNSFTVRVTDNGAPPLSDSLSFRVALIAPPSLVATITNQNTVRLTWTSAPTSRYRIESTPHLSPPAWSPLAEPVVASGSITTFADSPGLAQQRFYRILLLD